MMKSRMTTSTLCFAGCLAVMLYTPLMAQSTPEAITTAAVPATTPQQYLENARLQLARVSEPSLPHIDRKTWSALQKDFAALIASYGAAHTDTSAWQRDFSAVERNLAWLSDSGGSIPAGGEPNLAQTPKVNVRESSTVIALDAFRTDVELFYDAATTRADAVHVSSPAPNDGQ